MSDAETVLDELDGGDSPAWVVDLAELEADRNSFAQPPEGEDSASRDFLDRSQEAALLGGMLIKYRSWSQREGFLPLSFAAYLRRIEELTEVSFDRVLMHFGIAGTCAVDASSIPGLGRLWKSLGFTWRELRANLRISLLPPEALPFSRSVRMRDSAGSEELIARCEMTLLEIETRRGTLYLDELRRMESLAAQGYGKI
jgi:hypothetical protein